MKYSESSGKTLTYPQQGGSDHKYEIGISRVFRDNGFTLGAYANTDVVSKNAAHVFKVINPLFVFWRLLIKNHGFPFLKRELIIKEKY